jgi:RNA polymerase sigma-70 factor (ECF subfamily)
MDKIPNKNCDIFEVWEEHKVALYDFTRKRILNEEDAKDIQQEVLLKSYQYCAAGKTVTHLKSWLYKITQNTIIDYYRVNNKKMPLNFDITEDQAEVSQIGAASAYIRILLKELPEKYAIPLFMSDIEGIDQKQIAEKLNLTLSNTKSRIQRGRIKLKELFLRCCIIEFDESGEMINFTPKLQCKELNIEIKKLDNNK